MICPNCGKQLNENEKYCDNCGTNLNNIQQTNQQIENQNIQPMNNQSTNQNIQTETNQSTNENLQPKKNNNTGLIAIIIVLILAILAILYFFVLNKDNNSTANNVNNSSKYKLTKTHQTMLDQYKTPITTTSLTPATYLGDEVSISLKINNNKQVEITYNNQTFTANINNEKAKYIVSGEEFSYGGYATDIYILTEEGNVYDYQPQNNAVDTTKIISSNNNIKELYVVSGIRDYYILMFPRYLGTGNVITPAIIGKTTSNEYILLNMIYFSNNSNNILNLGTNKDFLLGEIPLAGASEFSLGKYYAESSLYYFSNGDLNYMSVDAKMSLVDNPNNFLNLYNNRNVKDEKGNNIKARYIIKEKDKKDTAYVITLDDKIYKIVENNPNIKVELYNQNKVSNIEPKYDENPYNKMIKSTDITYTDGKKETLNGTGILIFE